MGEGEVCVAVVSNVGEMENGKSQQKRDHCWLTGESDAEPLAKKQAVEGLVEDGIRVELCVQQNTKESLDGLELEHFDRSVTTEARNGSTPDSSDEDLIQQCFNAAKQQILGSKQAVECLDYVGLTSEQSVKEGSCDMELDSSGEKHSLEVLTDMEIEPVVEQPVKECLNEVGLESHGRMQTTGDKSDIEPELSIEQSVKECASEIETEACGKKQPAVIMNGSDQEHSVQKPVEECGSEIETEERVRIQPTEILNESEPECSVQKPVEECGTEIETEACGKIQPTEILNESEPERSVQKPIEECGSEIDTEACGKMQPIEVLNESVSEPSVQEPVTKCPSEMEMEVCGKILVTEVMNEREPESSVQKPVKECEIEIDAEACGKLQPTEVLYENESESKPFIQELVSECPSEIEMAACGKIQPTEVLNKSEPEPFIQNSVKECQSEMELEVCGRKQTTQDLCNTGIESSVGKQTTDALNGIELGLSVDQSVKEGQNEIVIDPCTKKEASNDDICSEVSNPNVSPRDNSPSFQTVTSQPDGKVVTKEQVVCGEITSTCSRNSSSEGSSSQEENGTNDTTTSNVVLEVPKDASTSSGVRKITFKFSKRKEDDDSQMSASDAKCMGYPYSNRTRKVPRSTHISEQGLHEYGDSLLHPTTKELMNGKGVPDGYPTTVKRLLSTRILDGAKVKYISSSGELIGIVKDCGYLCGCDACNFSIVLRAHEFEEHAGGKTKHPNNHIYLENGKPIYSIIQAMKAASLGTVDEAIKEVAGSSVNEELLQVWKASLQRNTNRAKTDNSHHMKLMNLYHSTTSYTSQSREDVSIPYHCYRKSFSFEPHALVNETMRERNRLFKKPKSLAVSTGVEIKRSADGGHKKRDNDLHRLLFMPNGLPDGTELAYYARGKKILEGYKQGNGIVCSHCDTEISPSQFEAHAGWAAKRQPYRHIYIPNGLTLHDIALLLANGQSIATSNSDDMCAVCGDRGELVICDGCPRAFHAACLGLEGVPSDDWHCPTCRDSIGSVRKAAAESRPIVIRLTRVVKAREYETGGCVICRAPDFSVAEFDDRTVMLCDQCEKEYHVGCLREGGICDLKALPSDKWFCCNHCDMIHGAIQDVVTNGAGVIPGSALSTINRKHIEKGVIGGAPNDIRWRMLSGKSRYPEHLPLLSTAAAIFRECFDPIVALSGRDLIPVMVYGRNISGQEFGGIYCVVLMVGSVVVSAGLLRVFGQEVAELPLVATSRQHQGKGYFQALFICIEDLLLSLGVKLLVLPAAEEAESIWTKKFGFTKMSDQQYTQYARDIQLTIFKGTTMLEKVLHPKDNR